jgi:putative peptide zinc metalloprotease protein
VSFAGAYCEMILWALATVTWRVTDPGTGLNYMALVVAATSAIKTLFNINPLIKLDGYYFLSDYLDIPNLRQRAFSYLGTQVKRVFRSAAQSTTGTSSRERWIYVTYGLLAFAYSFWLSGYVALWFGGLLVDRYQGWGFVLFSALLLAVFRRPLGRGFATLRVASGLKRVHPAGDQEAEGDPVPKPKRSAVTGAKIVAAAALVLAVLFFGRMPLTISGDFRILPRHNSDVRAEVEGIIEDIYVGEGDTVRPGQVIARLADRDYRAELREVTAQVEEKQAKLRLLKAGPRVEEIDRARASLEKTEERCKYASSQLSRLRPLFSQRLVSRQDLEEAEEEEAVRRKELEEAREQLRMLQAGSRPEEIEAAAAELSRLQARQVYLREQLALLEVTSPIAGVVTTHKLKERVGRHVKRGTLIAKVHDLTTVTAEIAVPEKEISDVRLGQAVTLKARAYPFRRFDGTVASIAPIAHQEKEEEGRWGKTVLVTTQLDNPGLLLKAEMTGYAKIYSGKRRVLDVLTRRLTRYVRVEFWSWW